LLLLRGKATFVTLAIRVTMEFVRLRRGARKIVETRTQAIALMVLPMFSAAGGQSVMTKRASVTSLLAVPCLAAAPATLSGKITFVGIETSEYSSCNLLTDSDSNACPGPSDYKCCVVLS
jgi:hypothetical protein